MDTSRDKILLEKPWDCGSPPWRLRDWSVAVANGVDRDVCISMAGHFRCTIRGHDVLREERDTGLDRPDAVRAFAARVSDVGREVCDLLRRPKAEGKRVAGHGAAAKGTIPLNRFGIGAHDGHRHEPDPPPGGGGSPRRPRPATGAAAPLTRGRAGRKRSARSGGPPGVRPPPENRQGRPAGPRAWQGPRPAPRKFVAVPAKWC